MYAMQTVFKYTGRRLRPMISLPLPSFAICDMTITQLDVAWFNSRNPTARIEDIRFWRDFIW